jgi:tRNA(adenine34) deaminase
LAHAFSRSPSNPRVWQQAANTHEKLHPAHLPSTILFPHAAAPFPGLPGPQLPDPRASATAYSVSIAGRIWLVLTAEVAHTIQTVASDPTPDHDEIWMLEALGGARRALEAGEVPVGAVVVCDGKIVGRGFNRNLSDVDPTAHAEVLALRDAGRTMGNHRLGDCELFVTIEPCAMCAGALVHARVRRLVFGADDPKAGAVHSVMRVLNHPALNHRMQVRGGVLAGSCSEILQDFFRSRR